MATPPKKLTENYSFKFIASSESSGILTRYKDDDSNESESLTMQIGNKFSFTDGKNEYVLTLKQVEKKQEGDNKQVFGPENTLGVFELKSGDGSREVKIS